MRTITAIGLGAILLWGCAVTPPATAQPDTSDPDLVGTWQATEDYFRPLILIEPGAGGGIKAYLTDASLSKDAPFSEATVRGDSLLLALDRLSIGFSGRVVTETRIEGTYTQGGQTVALTLVPTELGQAERPQNPQSPVPYSSSDITFEGAAGVRLGGTLTVPEGQGPFPAAVLLQGSGLSDRDAEVGGHKTFLVLADHLTRAGIAVLRYDKRGDVDLDGLTRDAEGAARYLANRPEVDPARVGLVGHSEGALIAPRAVGLAGGAFLVLLAPPAVPVGDALVEQNARLAAASGAPDSYVGSVRSLMRRVVEAAGSDADSVAAAAEIEAAFSEQGLSGDALEASVRAHMSPLFRDLAGYDPGPALRDAEVPVLAVLGSVDLFTPPEENAGPLREALAGRGTVRVVEGLNHWLQPAGTGLPDEIERIETTVDPAVLVLVADWIREQATAD